MRIIDANFDRCCWRSVSFLQTEKWTVKKPIRSYFMFWWAIDLTPTKQDGG